MIGLAMAGKAGHRKEFYECLTCSRGLPPRFKSAILAL